MTARWTAFVYLAAAGAGLAAPLGCADRGDIAGPVPPSAPAIRAHDVPGSSQVVLAITGMD
ncbi:MAG: hypothetical protein D6689_00010 [Deltaproteobacteria bacterium]|nr:MAG: hypothetical protein D6689_00010 [Deltaproteobacteria bacterium]